MRGGLYLPGRRRRDVVKSVFARLLVSVALLVSATPVFARNPEQPETAPRPGSDMTFLDHDRPGPIWFGAEANGIFQAHPSFPAPYTGANSLKPNAETALSGLFTIFFAYSPFRTTELIVDPEMALGGGLSQSLGVAGFPNLDVVRNPTLSHAPYVARLEIHQVVPLSHDWVVNDDRGPISSLAIRSPASPGVPLGQDVHRRSVRHQPRRVRQPPSVHELDGRQQWRLRLRRRHPRLHVRRSSPSIRDPGSKRGSARC